MRATSSSRLLVVLFLLLLLGPASTLPLLASTAAIASPSLCTFDGVDYATVNAGSALRKLIGEYNYYVSPCVDRLLGVSGGVSTCSGSAACQVSTFDSRSWSLAYIASPPVFSRVNSTTVKSVQTGSSIDCGGQLRVTTILYACAGYTTILSVAEPSACVYTIAVYTPLACPPTYTPLCAFQGMDFSLVGASNSSQALTVLTGTSNLGVVFQISLCTDRINVLQRSSSLDGVSICRYASNSSASVCAPLARVASPMSFTRTSGVIFTASTNEQGVLGCWPWTTIIVFYCAAMTSMVSASEYSCYSRLLVYTPIACTWVPPVMSSVPPLSPPRSSSGRSSPVEASGMSTSMQIVVVAGACVGAVVIVFVILSCRRRRLSQLNAANAANAGARGSAAARVAASSSEDAFHYHLHDDSGEGVLNGAAGASSNRNNSSQRAIVSVLSGASVASPASMELHSYAYEPQA